MPLLQRGWARGAAGREAGSEGGGQHRVGRLGETEPTGDGDGAERQETEPKNRLPSLALLKFVGG